MEKAAPLRRTYVVLALLVAASSIAQYGVSGLSYPGADFCEAVVNGLSQCPRVPTVDTVDLVKYQGRWYGVGVTAQFQFRLFGGRGGQCSNANYTLLGEINGQNTIKVVNRGIQFISTVRESQIFGISKFSQATGIGVRYLCQFLVGTEPLLPLAGTSSSPAAATGIPSPDSALAGLLQGLESLPPVKVAAPSATEMGAAAMKAMVESLKGKLAAFAAAPEAPSLQDIPLTVASLTGTITALTAASTSLALADKAAIAVQVGSILAAVAKSSVLASGVFDALASIQLSNQVLTGGTLPVPYDTPKTVAGIQAQTKLIVGLTSDLSKQTEAILVGAKSIAAIAAGKDPKVAAAAAGLALVAAPAGPLALSSLRIATFAKAISFVSSAVRPEPLTQNQIGVVGQAVQNASQPGALTVSFNGFGPPPASNNYNIIKLDGLAATGYKTALVYSCSTSVLNAFLPQIDLFIISRDPIISQATVDESLAFAAKQGIFIGGDNVFTLDAADPELCKPVYSLP